MKPLERFVDRPLPVFLAAALVIFGGVWALVDLPVKRAPDVEIPYSLVVVPYPGAAPDDVESEIAIDLEEELNTLENLRHLSSVSREGVATAVLEFEDRADMTESLRSVRDKTDLAEVEFPEEAEAAVVWELSFDDLPIVFFTLSGEADGYRLREIAEDLRPELESVPGVSQVDVFGGFEREVQVRADPAVLAHHDLTLADLAAAIERQSRSTPAGELRSAGGDRLLRPTGEFRTLGEIGAITVATEPGGPIALRDVASVLSSHERVTSEAWRNGEPSVTLIVRRRPDVNTMETVEQLRARVDALRAQLPPGVRIEVSSDSSEVIGMMIRQLGTSALVGLLLVVGVLLLMFGLRQALLVGSVLPFSLLFTFIGLYVFDMEISNIALFSLILVLGLVVDGAIVVGEAIYAEREGGLRSAGAAKAGLARVGLPVITADLTTIAAFSPMLLMVGVMGQFMSVMPKVVIFALAGSVFVDHLLLPAAAARLGVRRVRRRGPLAPDGLPWFSPELPRARRGYLRALELALRRRGAVIAGSAAAFAAAVLLFTTGAIDSIFLPSVDRGRFTLDYALPLGTSLSETSRVGRLLAREIEAIPEVESYVLTTGDTGALNTNPREGGRVGPEYGRLSVELVDLGERTRSLSQIVRSLRDRSARFAGVEIDFEELEEGPPVGAALSVRVQGGRLDELARTARVAEERIAALRGAVDVRTDYDRSKPEIHVDLDRPRAAAAHGITPDQVSRALRAAFRGVRVGRMWVGDERADIRLQAPESYAHTLEHVRELPLRAAGGAIVPLGEVAEVGFAFAHDAIYRHDTRRAITVRADAAEGHSSVVLEAAARDALRGIPLPEGVSLAFGGETEERERSYASLWSALKWGALLIYVIIAIQFDSLRQPLIVMVTVPLSVVGVAAGLLATGTPFSFMVFIGIVSLTGIVVNDGIVLIDAINRGRRAGMALADAIRDAALRRFRPVLLTTTTTIAGLLPLTLNVVDGGEFWAPLGIAIISGLLVASALTLLVVPVLYSLLEESPPGGARAFVRGWRTRAGAEPAPASAPTASHAGAHVAAQGGADVAGTTPA